MSDLVAAESHELTTMGEEQLVTMLVDDQLFGIPILKVQDIVEPQQITPVPLAPSAIAGVLNLRGRIVTVIDLRELLGATAPEPEKQMSVTVEHRGDLYTLLVDSIGDVRSMPRRELDKPPSTLNENMRRLCSGIIRMEDTLLVVLDVERILDEETIMKTPRRTRKRRVSPKEEQKRKSKTVPAPETVETDDADAAGDTPASGGSNVTRLKTAANEAKPAAKPKPEAKKPDPEPASSAPAVEPEAPSVATGTLSALGGAAEVKKLAAEVFELAMSDPTVSHFVEDEDKAIVKTGFCEFATTLLGDSSRDQEDLVVILELLVREQGLDDDHFIAIAKHAHQVLSAQNKPAEAVHAVLEAIDTMRNRVVKH